MPAKVLGTANKVAKAVRDIIDCYWKGEIAENVARQQLGKIMSVSENRIKVRRGTEYTGVFINIMGKRRIVEFERLTQ